MSPCEHAEHLRLRRVLHVQDKELIQRLERSEHNDVCGIPRHRNAVNGSTGSKFPNENGPGWVGDVDNVEPTLLCWHIEQPTLGLNIKDGVLELGF